MDWMEGKSYYTAYSSFDQPDSIVFFLNYFSTWSIGIGFSLILPILFLFAPSSLHTKRTSHCFIISCVCLSNMCSLYIQPYMLSGLGEPNLSLHTCRFMVYISTFAKPIGLYLTLIFSIERLFTKILSNFISRLNNYRVLFKKCYLLSICLGISFILSIRLYDVLKLLQINQLTFNRTIISRQQMMDNINISIDHILTFEYCYRSMTVETYSKILSFYIVQYTLEYIILSTIILILLSIIIYQYCLPYFQHRPLPHLSINTKFYLCLSSWVVLFELILQVLHLIVVKNDNSDIQIHYFQTMLFVYNFRCILLPLIICLTTCDPLRQWLYELLILRPYLDNYDENDHTDAMIDRSASSSQRTFAKNNNNEDIDM